MKSRKSAAPKESDERGASGFLRKDADEEKEPARRLFARITLVSGSGSQSHARPVNCRQLTRYTSRRRGVSSCFTATSLSALFRIAAVLFSPPARTPWRAAVNHRSRFCRHNAASSPLIVTKTYAAFIRRPLDDKDRYWPRESETRRASINLCTDFFGRAAVLAAAGSVIRV